MVNYSKRIIIVRGADLCQHLSLIFDSKICVFVSRPMEFVNFHRKKVTSKNGLFIFFWKIHIPKNHGNR